MNPCQRCDRLFVLVCVAAIVPAGDAFAATYTWLGTAENSNWFSSGLTLSSDWNPSGATLGSGDSLVFDEPSGGFSDPNQNGNAQITNLTISGIFFYELQSTTSSTLTISGVLLQDSTNPTSGPVIYNPVAFVTGSAVVNTQNNGLTLGVLTGSGNFAKLGSSQLSLSDASSYSGTMTISSSGSVIDDGNNFGGSIVNNGGYFVGGSVAGSYVQSSGTGSFSHAGSVNQTGGAIIFVSGTVTQASTLSGVNSVTGAPGQTMTFNSDLTLGSGNRTTFDLAAGGVADEYVVNGLLTYGGSMTLNFTSSGTETVGTSWSVFDPNGGVSGSFAGIGGTGVGPYSGLTWDLATSSTSVYDQRYGEGIWLSSWTGSGTSSQRLIFNQATGDFTVVPEPSTFVLAAAGIGGYALLRWRQGRRLAGEASVQG